MAKRKKSAGKKGIEKTADEFAGYINSSFNGLAQSFKGLGRGFLLAAAYELVFVILAYAAALSFNKSILNFATSKMGYFPEAAGMIQGADIGPAQAEMNILIGKLIMIVLGYFLLFILLYTAFNALIWRQISGKKPKAEFFWKFAVMESLWVIAWIIAFVAIANSIRQEVALSWGAFLVFSYFYLTTVMHAAFAKHVKIFVPMGRAFSAGIGKIHHFIVPYAYSTALFYVLYNIMRLLGQFRINFQAYAISFSILLVLYSAWIRFYINSIAEEIV